VNFGHDFPLEEDGPSFVEPEMFPGGVGDEVSAPAMSCFVESGVDCSRRVCEFLWVGVMTGCKHVYYSAWNAAQIGVLLFGIENSMIICQ